MAGKSARLAAMKNKAASASSASATPPTRSNGTNKAPQTKPKKAPAARRRRPESRVNPGTAGAEDVSSQNSWMARMADMQAKQAEFEERLNKSEEEKAAEKAEKAALKETIKKEREEHVQIEEIRAAEKAELEEKLKKEAADKAELEEKLKNEEKKRAKLQQQNAEMTQRNMTLQDKFFKNESAPAGHRIIKKEVITLDDDMDQQDHSSSANPLDLHATRHGERIDLNNGTRRGQLGNQFPAPPGLPRPHFGVPPPPDLGLQQHDHPTRHGGPLAWNNGPGQLGDPFSAPGISSPTYEMPLPPSFGSAIDHSFRSSDDQRGSQHDRSSLAPPRFPRPSSRTSLTPSFGPGYRSSAGQHRTQHDHLSSTAPPTSHPTGQSNPPIKREPQSQRDANPFAVPPAFIDGAGRSPSAQRMNVPPPPFRHGSFGTSNNGAGASNPMNSGTNFQQYRLSTPFRGPPMQPTGSGHRFGPGSEHRFGPGSGNRSGSGIPSHRRQYSSRDSHPSSSSSSSSSSRQNNVERDAERNQPRGRGRDPKTRWGECYPRSNLGLKEQ